MARTGHGIVSARHHAAADFDSPRPAPWRAGGGVQARSLRGTQTGEG
jgi:hypothetical protein